MTIHNSIDTRAEKATTKVEHNIKKRRPTATTVKRLTFHSASCSNSVDQSDFVKLDPSKPEHARRMQQRRGMIMYGKNTVGYDVYLQKVPKETRRPRSMDTPNTPDHTLDVPNKRWIGQVKAWRRALHRYDPADLQKSFAEAAEEAKPPADNNNEALSLSIQEQELAQAKSRGLMVDISETSFSPTSVVHVPPTTTTQASSKEMEELDQWDDTRGNNDFFCSDNDEDSDDDLL